MQNPLLQGLFKKVMECILFLKDVWISNVLAPETDFSYLSFPLTLEEPKLVVCYDSGSSQSVVLRFGLHFLPAPFSVWEPLPCA